jgi:hypothetical protein
VWKAEVVHLHRGLLFWGLALIVGGLTALAVQQGYVDRDLVAGAWRLWPLILVAIGLSIILSRTPWAPVGTITAALVIGIAGGALISVGPIAAGCTGDQPTTMHSQSGAFGSAATVELSFNCGTLEVGTNPGKSWTVSSGRAGGGEAQITSSANSLVVTSDESRGWWEAGTERWIVRLPTNPTYSLAVHPNAADASLDLQGARVGKLSVQPNAGSLRINLAETSVDELDLALNAGSVTIVMSQGSSLSGSISVNAGDVTVCVEGPAALWLTVNGGFAFSHNLDSSGLGRDGDTWSYAPPVPSGTVLSLVNLQIHGNAGSFELVREGGCS